MDAFRECRVAVMLLFIANWSSDNHKESPNFSGLSSNPRCIGLGDPKTALIDGWMTINRAIKE